MHDVSEQKLVYEAKNILLEKLQTNLPNVDLTLVDKALATAEYAHRNQYRASGAPYVLHPIAVAEILVDLNVDTDSIVTALLHDTVEDTDVTLEDLETKFGAEIAKLVNGVTKLTRIEHQPDHIKQAENFRKLLLAISEDIRVLLVKLADRLHNMRTLQHIGRKDKRLRTAHETMEIYAPLAERIGIHKFKNELQDLAFAELHPDIRSSILNRLNFLRKAGACLVESITKEIINLLTKASIKATVEGREKTPCSIWLKMEKKNVAFEQLVDIMAFRVIVEKKEECYLALGIINTTYHMVPGGFKDFISTPKANGYQSLHTVVMGPEQRCIEVQIRTKTMHEIAEFGVAAHWTYKQGMNINNEGTQFRWVRELLNILHNTNSPEEFLENTKLEMYYDQVFCFTPQGDLIALPRHSTPVDFAFAVHSKVGLSCIGARVNGRIVPLNSELHNGDQVEIMRSKTPMPSPAWEKFVVTGKARAEIRKFVRSKRREEYIQLGRAILSKHFQQLNKPFDENQLKPLLENFRKRSVEDILVSVGEGIITSGDVSSLLYPKETSPKRYKNPLSLLRFPGTAVEKKDNTIPIKGLLPGVAVHFATCCHPLPGDRIVGIVNTGKGITIHTIDCETLENFATTPEKWLDVSWDGEANQSYLGRIKVTLVNESGSLATLTSCIATCKVNISNLKVTNRSIDFFELLIDLDVRGTSQLNNVITSIRSLDIIHKVVRAKG
jgi:GTP pyrophosphokinase